MNKKRLCILLPLIFLTACGSNINRTVIPQYDHSTNWRENYYCEWNDKLKVANVNEHKLVADDEVFTSTGSKNFSKAFPDALLYNMFSEDPETGFGMHYRLSNGHNSFNNGFISKLFDGRIYCLARYEKVRVQTNESGFGSLFDCVCNSGDYFAMQFKSALDFKSGSPYSHESTYELQITLYNELNGSLKGTKYTYTFVDGATNNEVYHMFGFKVPGGLKGTCGMSLEYKLLDDEYIRKESINLDHALLVYEVFMPDSKWSNR